MFQVKFTEWTLEAKDSGKVFSIEGSITVGRQPECEISIPNGCVSRQHARLFIRDKALVVEDLGSMNGTSVNGKRIKQIVLKDGDEIGFDRYLFRVIRQSPPQPQSDPQPAESADSKDASQKSPSALMPGTGEQPAVPPPAAPISDLRPEPQEKADLSASAVPQEGLTRRTKWWQRPSSGPRRTVFLGALMRDPTLVDPQLIPPADIGTPVLVGLSEVVKGRRIELQAGSTIVGRSSECDEVIDDSHVSDKHAQLIVEEGSVSVVSLPNCTNGTFVNRGRAGGRVYLTSGDLVRFGDVDFVLWLPSTMASAGRSTSRLMRVYGVVTVVLIIAVIAALILILGRGQ